MQMEKTRIGIIGFGSIAKRHLENTVRLLNKWKTQYTIDLIRSGNGKPVEQSYLELIDGEYNIQEAKKREYDILFITNPTNLHYQTIKEFINCTQHMFIEKPITNLLVTQSFERIPFKKNGIYYVACPLRYTKVIEYLKENLEIEKVNGVRVICSSYLPDWRLGTDYRNTYSAHKNQGGGVSIDLIHEWDYLCYLFGKPNRVINMSGTYSQLELDSEDLSIYIARYPTFLAEVHLDYFGRVPIRKIELFMEDDTIIGDLNAQTITYLKDKKIIQFDEERNDYQRREIASFFDMISGKQTNHNTVGTALEILNITRGKQ